MRRQAFFDARYLPIPRGRYGFTEWQHECKPTRGWITPDLPVVLLDRLPFDPWLGLAEMYVEKGWQRDWPKSVPGRKKSRTRDAGQHGRAHPDFSRQPKPV